ncbi:NUDIX hydrolase [Pontibacillus salicampi]|uniref:NUDIX hydrolase n=1 Tax=Pontibacillus salicampi TaxID=1449801 RepID=A0ABV6LLX0_9BACI
MQAWQTLRSEYIMESPYGNFRKDTCALPNGNIIEDYYVNEYSDWVNAIVITKDRQLVLVKQYRQGGQDFFLEIPGGIAEKGEIYEEGITREVIEETGYISEHPPVWLGEFMVNPAVQNNKVVSYLFHEAYPGYAQDLDENEDIQLEIIPLDMMEDLIANQKITQLFTITSYYLAKSKGYV